MKKILKNIPQTFGTMLRWLFPVSLSKAMGMVKHHVYTGYYKKSFATWGKGAMLYYKAANLQGTERIAIGEKTILESGVRLTAWTKSTSKDMQGTIITIGKDGHFGADNHITAINKITIGNNILTGTNVLITDNNHGPSTADHAGIPPIERPLTTKGTITIGNNVWIGSNVCILGGVTIGDGAIIAANSVVNRNIPAGAVAAGVPATIVRQMT